MLLTENTSKAGQKQEQCQDIEVPRGTVLPQETLPVKINAQKSTAVSHHSSVAVAALTNSQQLSASNQHSSSIWQPCSLEVWPRDHWPRIKVSTGLHFFLEPWGKFCFLSFSSFREEKLSSFNFAFDTFCYSKFY